LNPNQRCIAHLESGGLVLAPDLRQARILRRLHDRAQAEAGRQVWPTAQILPFDAWLAGLWQRASADRPELPAPLAPVALRWIWWRQVARDAPGLLDPADLGARARASWLRLRAHGGELAAVARWPLTRDQQAFLGWARQVERELRERDACDAGDLARLLTECSAMPAPGPSILLAGFRRLTPAQASLLAALAASGHRVERLSPQQADGAALRHRAADPESERDAMIAWLCARVAAAPTGLHALIVPDLDANRGTLERALAASLQPELELPGAAHGDRIFDLAGGHPLAMQPVVDTALTALACAAVAVDWSDASRLLLATHLVGAEAERGTRITADLELREGQGAVRLRGAQLAAHAARAGAAEFASALRHAIAALDGPGRRSAGDWAEAFGAALAACGWPGDAPLQSREFQAARRFRELLQELASLATVAHALDVAEALAEIRRLAASPFQPESGEPAVFVLDVYEDPGVWLDSLWVAGLTATAWPRPAAVDPLLPIEIQRQLAVPGVTPEDCVADARAVLAGWRARSGSLVLSWPQFENDTEVDGSRLLPPDAADLGACAGLPTRERLAFAARQLEPLPEAALPPLAATQAAGGAKLLELQALCPFRAFAELRLGAARLEEPRAGFDRRLRGIALHQALQGLWSRLGAQAALAALDPTARQARIEEAVDAALGAVTPAGMGEPTLAIERDWQRQAIGRLLDLDLARPPFAVVETERALALALGGLELRLRVDRVDRIGEELVVIDYKTGTTKAAAWRGARMDAPQLPLYAVLHPDRPTGIAFAAVGAARANYLGVGRDGDAIAGMKAAEKFPLTEDEEKGFGWPEITAHWRAWLERLAADFAAGHAQVDPKLGADTCRTCHLGALCRVENAAPEEEEGADGD
jgi:ATP-dependent helicase/nuclease subunit B